jgi:hypothetical protein
MNESFNILKIHKFNLPINQLLEKTHMIIPVHTEKAFEKL